MARLRTAVIGVGHLGKEHARILAGFPEVELVGVADIDFEQAQAVATRCGTVAYRNHRLLLDAVEAATIAVPTINHFAVAGDFLRRGIPLLVEKPLADSLPGAEALVQLAHRHGVMLQVGHIERYNPAFEEVRRRGLRPRFVECERLGPFSGRSTDIGVVFDLMIHDLDLLLDLVGGPARSVEAVGWTVYGRHEDVAHARLTFADGCEAHVSASRASTSPRRCMRIWGETGYAALDFSGMRLALVEPSDDLREQGLELWKRRPAQLQRISEDVFGTHLRHVQPAASGGDQLTRELQDFVQCVRTGTPPRVGGDEGRDAVALAARIIESLQQAKVRGRILPWYGSHEGDAAA